MKWKKPLFKHSISNPSKGSTTSKPRKGDIFAVHRGDYAGEMLIYIEMKGGEYCFLATPTMENRKVPLKVFDNARNTGIIKYVEKAPRYVVDVSVSQYQKNEISHHRRKQHNPPHLVDCEESDKED